MKLNSSMQLTFVHDRLIKKDTNLISTNYTCHGWIDRKLFVCTAAGDILIAETTGDFKMILSSSPGPTFNIVMIMARPQDGFIVVDDRGRFKIYQISSEIKQPY